MSKESWYKRKHQFTPYTKADGQAVSDEFDAIQTSFERIPEMRDDGKGFKESPLIPEPTDPMNPVPLKMLTETEKSVNNARDDVTAKAQQVAQNTQSVATNTLTATQKANTATQAAASAQSSQQAAGNSENMAHKWAANPVNETVQGDKYSAYHYATKAAQSETTASSAAITSKKNADIATSKAEEAVQAAERARSLADGEVDYGKVLNVPSADTQTKGIVLLTNDTGLESESLGLTAKAGKVLAQGIAALRLAMNNYIPLKSRSSSVTSDDENGVATPKAVKTAYDKGVDAKTAADNANNNANGRVSKSGDTMTGNLTVPNIIVNDPTNNNNSVQIGDDTKLIDVDMGHTVGLQTTDNANDAYIAYGATKKRFGFDGVNFKADSGIAAQWYQTDAKGYGAFGSQWRDKTAPYVVHNPNANGSNAYFPFLKGFNSNGDIYGTAFSFGYMTPGHINQFGSGVIHLIEDNGIDKYWWFDHDGKLRADEFEAKGKRLSKAHQSDDKYVDVASQDNYGGLRIRKPDGKLMIFEREGDKFKYWAQDLYEIYLPQKSGTLMLDSDISYQKIGNFEVRKYPEGTMIQSYFVVY